MPHLTILLFYINIKYMNQNSLWPSIRIVWQWFSFWLHFYHQVLMRSLLKIFVLDNSTNRWSEKCSLWNKVGTQNYFIETFTIIGQTCRCCFDFIYLDPYVNEVQTIYRYMYMYDAYQNIWNTVHCTMTVLSKDKSSTWH